MDNLIIHSLIVHELRKQPEMAEADLTLSTHALSLTEMAQELVAKLDETFERKSDLLQGFLQQPDESLFPAFYQNWLQEGRKREGFVQFSQETMHVLKDTLQGVIGAKGGYLLFADYTIEEQRLLGIYFIRNAPGMVFTETEEGLTLDSVQYLDVANMAMAARVLAGNGRNVQMIRHARTQSSISQYFTDWVGLDRAETSSELTHSFLEVVEELPMPKDKETGQPMAEGDFEKAVMKYASKQPQQTIQVRDFDRHFYGDAAPLHEMLAEQDDNPLADGFRVDRKTMRGQFYLRAGFGGMSITCTKDHFRAGQIEVDEATGKVTITSDELASLLLDQLEGFRGQ